MSSDLFRNKYRIPSVRATWHDYNGRPLTAPTKGVNIVKYSDGSFEKEFVR